MELGVGRGPAAEESEISWVSSCRGYPEGLSCCVTTIHAILMHFLYFRINPTWRWWHSHHVQQFIFRITNDLLIYSVEEKNKYKISSGWTSIFEQISDEVKLDRHQSRTVTLPSLRMWHWQSLATLPHVRYHISIIFLCFFSLLMARHVCTITYVQSQYYILVRACHEDPNQISNQDLRCVG